MGIWSADILGNDAACEALRDLLDIAGYDVPPAGCAVTIIAKEGAYARCL